MILTNNADFTIAYNRERFARYLSCVIQGQAKPDLPYKTNRNDDWYWTLDDGNNWKVKFHSNQPTWFEIIFRYQCEANPSEEALAVWLKDSVGAEPILESAEIDRLKQAGGRFVMWHTQDGLEVLEAFGSRGMCISWEARYAYRHLRDSSSAAVVEPADFSPMLGSRCYVLRDIQVLSNGAQVCHYHEEGDS